LEKIKKSKNAQIVKEDEFFLLLKINIGIEIFMNEYIKINTDTRLNFLKKIYRVKNNTIDDIFNLLIDK